MSKLERLYHIFYRQSEQTWLNNNVERLRNELKASISDEDRKKVLRIVDDLSLIKDLQLKESFVEGLRLGLDLKEELEHYLHEEHTEK